MAGATWTFLDDRGIFNSNGGSFLNEGILRKNGGTGETSIGVTFTGDGGVFVDTGRLWVRQGGTSGGDFNLAAGTILRIGQGTPVFTFTTGASVSGPGELDITGIVVVEDDSLDVPVVDLRSGSLSINAPSATLNTLDWRSSSTLSVAGDLEIDTINFADTNVKTLRGGGRLVSVGTVSAGPTIWLGDETDIVNALGATWTWPASGGVDDHPSFGPGGSFINEGTLVKEGATTILDVPFEGSGDVFVNSGTLRLVEGGSTDSAFTVAGLAELQLGDISKVLTLESGATITGSGLVSITGAVVVEANALDVPVQLESGGLLTPTAPTFSFLRRLTWVNGSLAVPNEVVLLAGLEVTGGVVVLRGGGRLVNQGNSTVRSLRFTEGAELLNAVGAVWSIPSSGGFDRTGLGGNIVNAGTFRLIDGTGSIGVPFVNQGLLDLRQNKMTMQAGYTQTVSGVLQLDAAGLAPGTEHGQLVIPELSELDGTLDVDVSFAAEAGDVLDVIDFSFPEITGAFASTNFTGFTGPEPVLEKIFGNVRAYRLTFNAPITPIPPPPQGDKRPGHVGEKSGAGLGLAVTPDGLQWSGDPDALGYHVVRVTLDGARTRLTPRIILGGESAYAFAEPARPDGAVLYELERIARDLSAEVVSRAGVADPLGQPLAFLKAADDVLTFNTDHTTRSWLVEGVTPGFVVEDITDPEHPIPLQVETLAEGTAAYLSWWPERVLRVK